MIASIAPAELLRPPQLRPGDTIAVVTPSGPVLTPHRLQRAVGALSDEGFRVVVGPQASRPPGPGRDAQSRANEVNDYLRDPEVRAIVASIGGYTSNAVLNLLDYDAMREDPKIVCGYSDVTAILLAFYTQSRVVTFHGPTMLAEFGEYPRPLPFTWRSFSTAVSVSPMPSFAAAPYWTDELLRWETEDTRPRIVRDGDGWAWLSRGEATGSLVGGNLQTICALAGTRFMPSFDGALMFLETTSCNVDQVAQCLAHLEMLGTFDHAMGILFGRLLRAPQQVTAELEQLLVGMFQHLQIPVVANMDIGHTDPMLTLPIGIQARVDSNSRTLEYAHAAVR